MIRLLLPGNPFGDLPDGVKINKLSRSDVWEIGNPEFPDFLPGIFHVFLDKTTIVSK